LGELRRQQPEGVIKFPIQGSGKETRAFIFIDDMIDGVICVLEKGEPLGIYHIGNDEETSIETLAKAAAATYHREITVVPGALAAGGTLRRCPNINKVRALGFAPRVSLADGLAATVRWYDENLHMKPSKP